MRFARAVTSLAADVPLGHGLGLDVVIHGMTAVAKRAGRALKIIRRIQWRPPVRGVGNEILAPNLVRNVPLHRQREVVVADLLEITLFPSAAIDEGDVILSEVED